LGKRRPRWGLAFWLAPDIDGPNSIVEGMRAKAKFDVPTERRKEAPPVAAAGGAWEFKRGSRELNKKTLTGLFYRQQSKNVPNPGGVPPS